jgi:hypothetical protein
MPAAGQTVNVLICSSTAPTVATGLAGPANGATSGACASGQKIYVVKGYLPFDSSKSYFDGFNQAFSAAEGGAFFSFGFVLVVMFYLIGVKGSSILRWFRF